MSEPVLQPPGGNGLHFGPLGESWVHLCVDMQRMFAEETEWHTPWMERVLPNVIAVVELAPARTVFTRFIPPRFADERTGAWQRYYERWASMTQDRLRPEMIDLVSPLSRFARQPG
jgi:nicotinamidase-related amidase